MTAPVKKKRSRRRTCGNKRGTRTGAKRHSAAGEWACYPCHCARSAAAGKTPMSRQQLRRWRKTRKASRKAGHFLARRQRAYRRGYHAGLAVTLRDRDRNPAA